jgi:hypothetical protein
MLAKGVASSETGEEYKGQNKVDATSVGGTDQNLVGRLHAKIDDSTSLRDDRLFIGITDFLREPGVCT